MFRSKSLIFVVFIFLSSLILIQCNKGDQSKQNKGASGKNLEGSLTVSGAWALYPLAVLWAEEFQKEHPGIKFDISAGGAGKGISDVLSGVVDIGMVSREPFPEEIKKGAFLLPVTRDAVVPTANQKNPFINSILSKGMKRQEFIDVWITGKIKNWKELYPLAEFNGKNTIIEVYTRSDSYGSACGAAQTWAEFLGFFQENLEGIGVFGDPGLAEAVKKDPLGMGFNNINYVYDSNTKKIIEGLAVIPIDINENGNIEPEENFYEIRDDLLNAIVQKNYPEPLARNLYFVTNGKPGSSLIR
jgi:phosphate transport system substrate-binding protein